MPALEGWRWADPTASPAERVRRGYEAIRRGAGDDTFLLACGCPLGAVTRLLPLPQSWVEPLAVRRLP